MVNTNYVEVNYSKAIKMYRMELDQIPQGKKIYFKVCRKIRNAFVNIGKYRDAIHNCESAMSSSTYQETGVNELLCYVVLGYEEKSKRCFIKLMSLPLNNPGKEEGNFTSEINIYKGGGRCGDILEEEISSHRKAAE